MNKQHLLPILTGMLLLSCGKSGSDNIKSVQHPIQEEEHQEIILPSDGSNIQGRYLAKFKTLNSHVNGTVPGSVTFLRDKDKVMVYLRLFAGYPKAWHQQKIYEGSRCPTIADDTNGDGYIDIFEAEAVLGKQLIPLDADISSQKSGRNFFPLGDPSGSYYYERITSFSRMFRDLKDIKNAGEEYKKLAPEEGLSIEGKTILIQGVSAEVEFPETVQSSPRYKPFQTLPIVCGVFEANNLVTGNNDNGEIPGPIADIEEGQDRPAKEGDGETQREGTGNRGGRTNDAGEGNGPVVDGDGRAPTEPSPRRPDNYGEANGSSENNNTTTPSHPPRVTPPREAPPAPEVTPPAPEVGPTPPPPIENPAPEVENDSEE